MQRYLCIVEGDAAADSLDIANVAIHLDFMYRRSEVLSLASYRPDKAIASKSLYGMERLPAVLTARKSNFSGEVFLLNVHALPNRLIDRPFSGEFASACQRGVHSFKGTASSYKSSQPLRRFLRSRLSYTTICHQVTID